MARLPTLLLAVLILLASSQCFGKCLSDSCKETNSAPCHPQQKTASHCSNDFFIADEAIAAAQHPPDIGIPQLTVSPDGALLLPPLPVTVAQFASPPLLIRSITILKI
jgi:hypothetical protein